MDMLTAIIGLNVFMSLIGFLAYLLALAGKRPVAPSDGERHATV